MTDTPSAPDYYIGYSTADPIPASRSFAEDSGSERGTTTSSRRRWGFRSFFSTANEDANLDGIEDQDDDDDTFAMMQTNGLSDRNTIVDMSLRLDRFVIIVAVALAASFLFAYLTNSPIKLTTVPVAEEASVDNTVEMYNSIFGFVTFAAGSVFAVYCETLIFPTLNTYLHNCSLYPGDQPARVHSRIKVRAIFWGLKTVIILMNVAFASMFVGQRTITTTVASRRLMAGEDIIDSMAQLVGTGFTTSSTSMRESVFRSSLLGYFDDLDAAPLCDEDLWIEPPTVSLGVKLHDWSSEMNLKSAPVMKLDISRAADSYNDEKLLPATMGPREVLHVVREGVRVAARVQAFESVFAVQASNDFYASFSDANTVGDLVGSVVRMLNGSLADDLELENAGLHFEKRMLAEDIEYLSVTVELPRRVSPQDGSLECGLTGCVFTADQSSLTRSRGAFIAPLSSEDSTMLTLGIDHTFKMVEDPSQAEMAENVVISFGKLSWRLHQLDERHSVKCAIENDCLGVSIQMLNLQGEILAGKYALMAQYSSLHEKPLQLIKITPAVAWMPDGNYATWHWVNGGSATIRTASVTSECLSSVDWFRDNVVQNGLRFSNLGEDMYAAAVYYLLQDGVATRYHYSGSRRLSLAAIEAAEASASGSESNNSSSLKEIEVAVPTVSALISISGCIVMLFLMLCVVFLPTARVKLSPNTTAAAQYVQILTDDLYPDIVHKKRLRFANGDCLLFNEYIIDSIVLHAERNHRKKIYL